MSPMCKLALGCEGDLLMLIVCLGFDVLSLLVNDHSDGWSEFVWKLARQGGAY